MFEINGADDGRVEGERRGHFERKISQLRETLSYADAMLPNAGSRVEWEKPFSEWSTVRA